MKKLMVGAVALVVAVLGFGSLTAPTTQANPLTMYVVNTNVAAALAGMAPAAWTTALTTSATTRATISSGFAAAQAASGGQLNSNMTASSAGDNWVIVVTNDSTQTIVLNGRGLTCSATLPSTLCDNAATQLPNATDKIALWNVTAAGTFPGGVVTATQAGPPTSLDSTALTVAGAPHDLQLAVLGTPAKTTVQEGAASCSATASSASPSVGTAQATYVDINGKALVGLNPTFASAATANLAVGSASTFPAATNSRVTMVNADKSVSAQNAFCGVVASTGVTLSASSTGLEGQVMGVGTGTTPVTRTQKIVVTGVPAAIALTASPAAIACDGTATSSVTAKVTDSAGNNVVDNTPVTFSVVALGTANPIQTSTKAGTASSTITPLSGSAAGTTVIVTSGSVQASIRVDCLLPTPTTPPAPVATSTRTGTIGAPKTGTGGYLGQDSTAGFPLWTLIALGLGSVALVAGGLVTRRAGK